MSASEHRRLYDIGPLLSHLEAGAVLLTPNFRLARRIRREWDLRQAALGHSAWRTLPVYALENWLELCWRAAVSRGELPAKTLLDPPRARELWLQVIEEDGLASGEYSLLQPSAAADIAAQARENLLRWQVDTSADAVRSEFCLDDDCGTFLRWLTLFDQRLEQLDLATPGDCVRDLLNIATARSELLVLLDFDDTPPLHRACLEALGGELREVESGGAPGAAQVRAFADRHNELEAVARWSAALHREQAEATVGIVLVDMQADRPALEYLLRREFGCLGDKYDSLPINFSAGITLERTPMVRDALRILDSVGPRLPLADVLALLGSRFLAHADGESDLAIPFLTRLFDNGQEVLDSAELRAWAQQVSPGEAGGLAMGHSLYAVAQLRLHHKKQPPSKWVEDFCQALDCWGWPGPGPLDSVEHQQLQNWYRALELFAGYDHVLGRVDLARALQALRRHCQAQVSQPQTADSNIQVLGTLEAAGLSFDEVWLVGLQATRWPPPPRPNPFIPMALQRELRMPHASSEREWRFATTLMHQYRCGSARLQASFCRELDGVPELPSPLLSGLPLQEEPAQAALPAHWLEAAAGYELESLVGALAPAVSVNELDHIRGGSGILEDQANCPFRAFARRRLGISALGKYRTALSAAERGTILHDALYALWGELEGSAQLQALDDGASRALVAAAARIAVEGVPAVLRQRVGLPCLELEETHLRSLLLDWVSLERERQPFTVRAREQAMDVSLCGIPLSLRVDRVDQMADGQLLLIDYKSGRSSLADWLGERPSRPQLPLYGVAGERISALAFAEVRSRECRLQGLGEISGEPWLKTDIPKAASKYCAADNWDALLQEWRVNLERLAAAFMAGQAGVEPLARACDYCGLQSLCRIELQQGEQA